MSNEHTNTMQVPEIIGRRRSVKRFTQRQPTREEIEMILQAAALAPNHRLTQPWRFYVLGPEARHAYGLALGNRKARKIEDVALAQKTRETTANEHRDLPAMIVIAQVVSDNPEIAAEDLSACMMAVQNLSLAAVSLGFQSHIKTGAIMDDPAARAAAGVKDNEKIVAAVNVGEPDGPPPEKKRDPATAFTTWMP
jgi:nitroreductase